MKPGYFSGLDVVPTKLELFLPKCRVHVAVMPLQACYTHMTLALSSSEFKLALKILKYCSVFRSVWFGLICRGLRALEHRYLVSNQGFQLINCYPRSSCHHPNYPSNRIRLFPTLVGWQLHLPNSRQRSPIIPRFHDLQLEGRKLVSK